MSPSCELWKPGIALHLGLKSDRYSFSFYSMETKQGGIIIQYSQYNKRSLSVDAIVGLNVQHSDFFQRRPCHSMDRFAMSHVQIQPKKKLLLCCPLPTGPTVKCQESGSVISWAFFWKCQIWVTEYSFKFLFSGLDKALVYAFWLQSGRVFKILSTVKNNIGKLNYLKVSVNVQHSM